MANINPWTTNARKTDPSAADGVTLTTSASSWANSSWVQIDASIANAWLLNGIEISNISTFVGFNFEIDVGVGGAGSEVVKATFAGTQTGNAQGPFTDLKTPILIDSFAASSRVAVRIRCDLGSASTLQVDALFYEKTITGSLYSTTQAPEAIPSASGWVSLTNSATTWASGSYTQIIASTSGDKVLVGVLYGLDLNGGNGGEIDIATGGAGSEVVKTTIHDHQPAALPNYSVFAVPLDTFPSGSRIAARCRTGSGDSRTLHIKLFLIPKALGTGVPTGVVSTKGHSIAPAAADPLTVTPTSSATYGSWVQVIASTSNDIHVASLIPYQYGNGEVQIGTGGAGSETVIATVHVFGGNQGMGFRPWPVPKFIASGTRVSVRSRGAATPKISLAYTDAPDSLVYTTLVPKAEPDSATMTSISPSSSTWVNTSWVQVTAGLSNIAGLYGIVYSAGSDNKHVELDIGVGGAGSEVVATTFRSFNQTTGWELWQLTELLKVATSTRIAIRMRIGNPTSFSWTVGIEYLDNFDSTAVTPSGTKFRKTLSALGTRVGSRQLHADAA
jgi:hypothetical protein